MGRRGGEKEQAQSRMGRKLELGCGCGGGVVNGVAEGDLTMHNAENAENVFCGL